MNPVDAPPTFASLFNGKPRPSHPEAADVTETVAQAPTDPRRGFADFQRKRGLSEETIDGRDGLLRRWGDYLAPRSYFDASSEDVDGFCPTRPAKTRCWYLSNLSSFYQFALRHDLTLVDPTAKIDRPRVPRPEPRPAKKGDVRFALSAADIRLAAMIALGVYAGLRCKEIAGLHADDVDFDAGWLYVRDGKGGHQRKVPIATDLEKYLRAYGMTDGWMFPSERAPHVYASSVSRLINDHFRALGLTATAHQLRHLFGSTAGRKVKIEVLSAIMGHASVATTQMYRQVTDDEMADLRGLTL